MRLLNTKVAFVLKKERLETLNLPIKRFCLLFIHFLFASTLAVANQDLQNLLDKLNETNQIDQKLELYWTIYKEAYGKDNHLAYKYAKEYNKLAMLSNKSEHKSNSYWALAWLSRKRGRLDDSFENYLQVIHWSKLERLEKRVGFSLKNIGNIFQEIGEFDKAYQYYFDALDIYKELDLKPEIINAYRSISICKRKEGKFNEALKYAERALNRAQHSKNYKYINLIKNGIGTIYFAMEDYKKAREMYLLSIDEIENVDNQIMVLSIAYNNIGETYLETGDLPQAKSYFEKALKMKFKTNDKNRIAFTLNNLGKLALVEHKTDSAIIFLERALSFIDSTEINDDLPDAPSLLIQAYESKKNPSEDDYKRVLELNRTYIAQIRNSNIDKNQKLLGLMEINDEIQEEAQYLQQKTKTIQNRTFWIIVIAAIAVLGLLILLYYRERRFKNFMQRMWEDIKDI